MISVVLPTYNESETIVKLVDRLLEILSDAEVVVVDDDSPDSTWKLVKNGFSGDSRVRVIRRVNERGLVTAIRHGISESRGEVIVIMDADLSHPPEVIPKLVELIGPYDIVNASRHSPGGEMEYSFSRVFTSNAINLFARIMLTREITDYTGGFIAVKREIFKKTPVEGIYGEYCIRFLYEAKNKGYKIKEVPYTYKPRMAGETHTTPNVLYYLKWAWVYGSTVLKLRLGG